MTPPPSVPRLATTCDTLAMQRFGAVSAVCAARFVCPSYGFDRLAVNVTRAVEHKTAENGPNFISTGQA
jgi:hypothetical protein